jgi:hypothetical protein
MRDINYLKYEMMKDQDLSLEITNLISSTRPEDNNKLRIALEVQRERRN